MTSISKQRRKELDSLARYRAEELRRSWGLGIEPIGDIFDLIERRLHAIILRYPVSNSVLSAFIAKKGEDYLIYINTNMTLGHQIFSAAHEISHFLYDADGLELLICRPGGNSEDEKEILADCFAGYFLLPEEGVRNAFFDRFGSRHQVDYGTVMTLQGTFKVSYTALLYALLKYHLINGAKYGTLKKLGTVENVATLQRMAKNYDIEPLIIPTAHEIPKSLIIALNKNYKEERISYKKLAQVLSLWDKQPEEMGFSYADPI